MISRERDEEGNQTQQHSDAETTTIPPIQQTNKLYEPSQADISSKLVLWNILEELDFLQLIFMTWHGKNL